MASPPVVDPRKEFEAIQARTRAVYAGYLARLKKILRDEPGLVLTLGYLVVTAVGMWFSWKLFAGFGINVFDYGEVGDFLLAAFREPASFLIVLVPVLVLFLAVWSSNRLKERPSYVGLYRYRWIRKSSHPLLYPLVFLLYAHMFVDLYTEWLVDRIQSGKGKVVQVEMASGRSLGPGRLMLVGKAGGFLILYRVEPGRTEIVPVESISRVIVGEPLPKPEPKPEPPVKAPGPSPPAS